MNTESQIHAICLLCRLLLDTSIVKDCGAVFAVDKAFTSLMDSVIRKDPENEVSGSSTCCSIRSNFLLKFQYVLTTIYPSVTDTTLRSQLLKNIPTSSPKLNLFRRRLALSFFFEDASFNTKPPKSLLNLRSIARHLQGPQFVIRRDTDFSNLAALITILSIGIDNGDQPPAGSDKQEEIAFNKDVDALSRSIYDIFTSIVDTGASHMKRTEAKEVLEGFHSRLLYVIRTERKPKSMSFESKRDGELGSMKNGMHEFLHKSSVDTQV